MTLAFRRSGLGLEHCGFMYIGKLQQWHYAALRIIGVDLAGLLGGGRMVDPSAAEFRRQPEACRAAAAGKNSARRRASRNLWTPPPPYFSRRAAALVKNRLLIE